MRPSCGRSCLRFCACWQTGGLCRRRLLGAGQHLTQSGPRRIGVSCRAASLWCRSAASIWRKSASGRCASSGGAEASPRSFLARSDDESRQWREDFIQTFLEPTSGVWGAGAAPDAPALLEHGRPLPRPDLERLGDRALAGRGAHDGASGTSTSCAGPSSCGSFPPWYENLGKRQVKSPKVYLRDSGLLHALWASRRWRLSRGTPEAGRVLGRFRAGGSAPGDGRPRSLLLEHPGRGGAGPARLRQRAAIRIRVQVRRCPDGDPHRCSVAREDLGTTGRSSSIPDKSRIRSRNGRRRWPSFSLRETAAEVRVAAEVTGSASRPASASPSS